MLHLCIYAPFTVGASSVYTDAWEYEMAKQGQVLYRAYVLFILALNTKSECANPQDLNITRQ